MTYLQPILLALLCVAAVAVVRLWRSTNQPSVRVVTLVLAALFLISWPPIAWIFCHSFESVYPPKLVPPGDAQAIVVLASTVYSSCPPLTIPIPGYETYDRCRYAAWLYTNWRQLPVLASGGGSGDPSSIPFSVTMQQELQRDGVPDSHIWREERSRSTYENALYSSKLLQQKGIHNIVLVTDAYHMLRADLCFRKQGLAVVPAPCGFRTFDSFHADKLLPGWEAISWNEDTLHESLGLLWYRFRHRI